MTDDLDRFHQLLDKLQAERVWVDEKYALPVEPDLLVRFIRGETSQVTSEFVLAQISGFKSWNEAFLNALENAANKEHWE